MQGVSLCEGKTKKGRLFMKKILLALLVLTIVAPAMAANDVVFSFLKAPNYKVPPMTQDTYFNDYNAVVLHYVVNNGKEVRAFALNVVVSDGAYIVGSAKRVSTDYYVTPTNITFKVVGGNTLIDQYGSPVVSETANGFIVEMASLYDPCDPCSAHRSAPATSGDLIKFYVNNTCAGNTDRKVTFTVTQNTTPRGGIVMLDGTTSSSVTFPSTTFYLPCLDCSCMVVGQTCGGLPITQTRYNNWVAVGKPKCWCHPGHYAADSSVDCKIASSDMSGPNLPYMVAAYNGVYGDTKYQPGCDVNNDKKVTSTDMQGNGTGIGLVPNYNQTIANCP
jgi:hypothetical protein